MSTTMEQGVLGDVSGEVLNSLYWDLALPRDRVHAQCEKGWVTLTGEVERAYQRSSAEADVLRVRGVIGVTNAIIVAATATIADQGRKAGLRADAA
jgi:hyperosmotically inducible protein